MKVIWMYPVIQNNEGTYVKDNGFDEVLVCLLRVSRYDFAVFFWVGFVALRYISPT